MFCCVEINYHVRVSANLCHLLHSSTGATSTTYLCCFPCLNLVSVTHKHNSFPVTHLLSCQGVLLLLTLPLCLCLQDPTLVRNVFHLQPTPSAHPPTFITYYNTNSTVTNTTLTYSLNTLKLLHTSSTYFTYIWIKIGPYSTIINWTHFKVGWLYLVLGPVWKSDIYEEREKL